MNTSDFINNREIATLIWIIFLFILAITQKAVRKALYTLIKTIFSRKLLFLFSTLFIYIVFIVFILSKIGFWDITATKDTLIWIFGSAVVILVNISNSEDTTLEFNKIVIENVKLIFLLEFILNLYTFPFIIELFLVPVVSAFALIDVILKKKSEYKSIVPIIEGILGIIGLVIMIFTIVSIFSDIQGFIKFKNIRDFLLPIVFSLAYLPFVYVWALIMNYESFFIRLYIDKNNKELLSYSKKMTILKCNINLSRINHLAHKVGLLQVSQKEDIVNLIESV